MIPLNPRQRELLTSEEFRTAVDDEAFVDDLTARIESAGEGDPADVDLGPLVQQLVEELAEFANLPAVDPDQANVAAELAAELPLEE